jgi:hypothetical protein
MRRVIPLAAVAAALAAVPASAAYTPACTTQLVNAAAGASASCATQSDGNYDSALHHTRTANIVVTSGAARLTLTCSAPWRSWTGTTTVTAPGWDAIGTSDDYECVATVVALVAGTTAVVTSHGATTVNPY